MPQYTPVSRPPKGPIPKPEAKPVDPAQLASPALLRGLKDFRQGRIVGPLTLEELGLGSDED